MEYKNLKLDIKDSIAKITLTIPANRKFPTLDMQTGKELLVAIEECEKTEQVRVLIITGSGKAFSAGGDIKKFKESIETGESGKLMDDLTKGFLSFWASL